MRRRITLIAIATVVLAALLPISAQASSPSGVYLSLGDSLAAGEQASEGKVTDDSYTDVLFARIADDLGVGTHVKLGCPGETSTTFLAGGCPGEAAMGGYATGSQFGDAMAAIAAAGPDLKLITIDIGANDVLSCMYDLQGQPSLQDCIEKVAVPTLIFNLTYTLAALQQVAPGVPIVGMNYYNPNYAWVLDDANAPFPGFGESSQGLVAGVNDVLAATYAGAFGQGAVTPVPVADVAAAYSTFDYTRNINLRKLCRFTGMCERSESGLVMSDWNPAAPGPQPDIHPTDIGYRKIALTFKRLLIRTGII